MKNRPTFEPHDDFNFDPKKIGHLSRQEFIRFVRESHDHMRELSSIIERYGLTLDDYLEQWDGNLESFDDDVKVLLGEWIEDGTLDHIINENLMSIKADKSYVDNLNEYVTAQLDHINEKKIDKNRGDVTSADLSQEVKEQLTGGSVAVVGENTVLEENIVDGQVSPKKTTFFRRTRNLFDGNYVNGILSSREGTMQYTFMSEFNDSIAVIPIEPNQEYSIKVHDIELSDKLNIAVHNSEPEPDSGLKPADTFVAYLTGSNKQHTFTNDENGKYLMISVSREGLKPRLQVEIGGTHTSYIPHLMMDEAYIDEDSLPFIREVQDGTVTPEKTTFFEPLKNLFDGNYVRGGMYHVDGILSYSLLDSLTESLAIIPILPNETYTLVIHEPNKSDKLHIGILNDVPVENASTRAVDTYVLHSFNSFSQHTFTNTSEGKYMIVSVSSNGQKPRLQVEVGDQPTAYEEFPKISDKYIKFKDDDDDDIVVDYEAEKESTGLITTPAEKAKIIPLMSGENSDISVIGGTFQVDNNIKKGAESGVRFSITSTSSTPTPYLQRTISDDSATGVMAVGMWVYINDVSKINNLFINVVDDNNVNFGVSTTLLAQNGIFIKEGWNLLRFRVHTRGYEGSNFGRITRVRVLASANEPTEIIVGSVWAEKFEKAKLLFIHDGGYSAFFQEDGRGYEDLKARGIPCTIATIPYNIGNPENDRFISKRKLYELSLENNNDISIHSYAGQDEIATMTPEEIAEESFNAIDMLRGWGYNPLWRSAWFRNNAPNAHGAKGLFHAFAYSSSYSMIERIESFPFENRYNVSRIQIHWRDRADIDKHFDVLKSSKGVMVAYTHNVADDSSGDISEADWDYFLSKIDEGLDEGWLEGTTFKRLIEPYY